MNPLHLFWIIPVSAWTGFALCALLTAGKLEDEKMEIHFK